MKKRFLSVLLAMCLVVFCLPISASAVPSLEESLDGFRNVFMLDDFGDSDEILLALYS